MFVKQPSLVIRRENRETVVEKCKKYMENIWKRKKWRELDRLKHLSRFALDYIAHLYIQM